MRDGEHETGGGEQNQRYANSVVAYAYHACGDCEHHKRRKKEKSPVSLLA